MRGRMRNKRHTLNPSSVLCRRRLDHVVPRAQRRRQKTRPFTPTFGHTLCHAVQTRAWEVQPQRGTSSNHDLLCPLTLSGILDLLCPLSLSGVGCRVPNLLQSHAEPARHEDGAHDEPSQREFPWVNVLVADALLLGGL